MPRYLPTYKLEANSQDITDTIRARFISMSWTDAVGMQSDMLEIALSDSGEQPIAIPASGAELELWLGYDEAQKIGLFVLDEVELSGWPSVMVLRGRAAPFDKSKNGKANLQSQKTRSWRVGKTIAAVVQTIAKEHGMEAVVDKDLASIALPHLDQAAESDLNFLIRLAKRYDATIKPTEGKLVFAKRGNAKSASGADMPEVVVKAGDCARFRMQQVKKDAAGTVVTYWHSTKLSKRNEVKTGSGEPVRQMRQYYPTKAMAEEAGKAEYQRRLRGAITLELEVVGDPGMVAEAPLSLEDFRDGIPSDWVIVRAEHTLDSGGYRTRLSCEQKNSDAKTELGS